MKYTYYAIIDGKEVKLRTSKKDCYKYACVHLDMYAKTLDDLKARIHSWCYFLYNRHSKWGYEYKPCEIINGKTIRYFLEGKELKDKLDELKKYAEEEYLEYVSQCLFT